MIYEIELINAIRFLMGNKMEIGLIVNLKELMLIKLLVIWNLSYQCNLVKILFKLQVNKWDTEFERLNTNKITIRT